MNTLRNLLFQPRKLCEFRQSCQSRKFWQSSQSLHSRQSWHSRRSLKSSYSCQSWHFWNFWHFLVFLAFLEFFDFLFFFWVSCFFSPFLAFLVFLTIWVEQFHAANIVFSASPTGKHQVEKRTFLRGIFCFHILKNMRKKLNLLKTDMNQFSKLYIAQSGCTSGNVTITTRYCGIRTHSLLKTTENRMRRN